MGRVYERHRRPARIAGRGRRRAAEHLAHAAARASATRPSRGARDGAGSPARGCRCARAHRRSRGARAAPARARGAHAAGLPRPTRRSAPGPQLERPPKRLAELEGGRRHRAEEIDRARSEVATARDSLADAEHQVERLTRSGGGCSPRAGHARRARARPSSGCARGGRRDPAPARESRRPRDDPGGTLEELEEWGARVRVALFVVPGNARGPSASASSSRRTRSAPRCSARPSARRAWPSCGAGSRSGSRAGLRSPQSSAGAENGNARSSGRRSRVPPFRQLVGRA